MFCWRAAGWQARMVCWGRRSVLTQGTAVRYEQLSAAHVETEFNQSLRVKSWHCWIRWKSCQCFQWGLNFWPRVIFNHQICRKKQKRKTIGYPALSQYCLGCVLVCPIRCFKLLFLSTLQWFRASNCLLRLLWSKLRQLGDCAANCLFVLFFSLGCDSAVQNCCCCSLWLCHAHLI